MPTDTVSINAFITANKITLTASRANANPSMPDSHDMDHWKCVLHMKKKRMTVYFSMGYGFNGRMPEPEDVLSCLASDASSASMAFGEFCSEFGYDPDSRKAERIHKTLEHQDKRLQSFLGADLYETLVYRVEAL